MGKLEALKLFLDEQREFLVDSAIQRSVAKAKEYEISRSESRIKSECQERRQEI